MPCSGQFDANVSTPRDELLLLRQVSAAAADAATAALLPLMFVCV
jgi:hypothetical protein